LFVHRPETVGQLCSHANVDGAQSEKGRAARDIQCAWRAAAFDNVGSGELLFAGSTPGRAHRDRETHPFRGPS
jgi:nitrite reductase/ring-hydroxylating ferredoxin subunit